jgi:uncharacterized protein YaaQ
MLVMKLLLAIIQADDNTDVMDALTHAGYRVTKIATQGGWLRRENSTLLIGLQDNQAWHAAVLLKRVAGRRTKTTYAHGDATIGLAPEETTIEVGGITLFVLDVERLERM